MSAPDLPKCWPHCAIGPQEKSGTPWETWEGWSFVDTWPSLPTPLPRRGVFPTGDEYAAPLDELHLRIWLLRAREELTAKPMESQNLIILAYSTFKPSRADSDPSEEKKTVHPQTWRRTSFPDTKKQRIRENKTTTTCFLVLDLYFGRHQGILGYRSMSCQARQHCRPWREMPQIWSQRKWNLTNKNGCLTKHHR